MLLVSDDGASVSLRITGYQFPEPPQLDLPTDEYDWDANWLVIDGEVRTAAGRTWSFTEPCLLTSEAAELRDWLHSAADGSFTRYRRRDGQTLAFLEPNLELSLRRHSDQHVTVRIALAAESATPTARPPWAIQTASVLIRTDPDALHKAADEWDDELSAYPER